jgi:multimeric flavodoxin WrbA
MRSEWAFSARRRPYIGALVECLLRRLPSAGHTGIQEGRISVRVIGFNVSPRKGANTATVVEAVLKGAAAKGAETQLVNLNRLNMKCCQGCEGCKKNLGHCVQKDDLSPLLEEMPRFDAIVMGTPIYWFHVNAQFKTLIDRLYCFYGFDTDAETGDTKETVVFPEGKKFVVVTSRGDPEDKPMVPQLYDYLNEWLNIVGMAMGASSVEFIHHYGSLNAKDSARNDVELLARAQSVGASLV